MTDRARPWDPPSKPRWDAARQLAEDHGGTCVLTWRGEPFFEFGRKDGARYEVLTDAYPEVRESVQRWYSE